ncbi:MAG: hypothetical protein ACE5KF_07070, partial [Kiloniellaceae bacterium]
MNPKRYLPVVGLLLGLSACADLSAGRTLVKTGGAALADPAAEDAEWVLCNAITVGAARRRYGISADRAEAYNDRCEGDGEARII